MGEGREGRWGSDGDTECLHQLNARVQPCTDAPDFVWLCVKSASSVFDLEYQEEKPFPPSSEALLPSQEQKEAHLCGESIVDAKLKASPCTEGADAILLQHARNISSENNILFPV